MFLQRFFNIFSPLQLLLLLVDSFLRILYKVKEFLLLHSELKLDQFDWGKMLYLL